MRTLKSLKPKPQIHLRGGIDGDLDFFLRSYSTKAAAAARRGGSSSTGAAAGAASPAASAVGKRAAQWEGHSSGPFETKDLCGSADGWLGPGRTAARGSRRRAQRSLVTGSCKCCGGRGSSAVRGMNGHAPRHWTRAARMVSPPPATQLSIKGRHLQWCHLLLLLGYVSGGATCNGVTFLLSYL